MRLFVYILSFSFFLITYTISIGELHINLWKNYFFDKVKKRATLFKGRIINGKKRIDEIYGYMNPKKLAVPRWNYNIKFKRYLSIRNRNQRSKPWSTFESLAGTRDPASPARIQSYRFVVTVTGDEVETILLMRLT